MKREREALDLQGKRPQNIKQVLAIVNQKKRTENMKKEKANDTQTHGPPSQFRFFHLVLFIISHSPHYFIASSL